MLPESLINLTFGYRFNQIFNDILYSGLKQLTNLTFGDKFNKSVDNLSSGPD